MKGRTGKKVGGVIPATRVSATPRAKIAVPAAATDDLPVTGKISAMRLDRPGRKLGGRCGAELSPLSMAGKTTS